jgi:hypothetical protein
VERAARIWREEVTMPTRRAFLGAITAAATAASNTSASKPQREPEAVNIYMVTARLKCTATQAALVQDVLKSLGESWGTAKHPEDWIIKRKLYGTWEF